MNDEFMSNEKEPSFKRNLAFAALFILVLCFIGIMHSLRHSDTSPTTPMFRGEPVSFNEEYTSYQATSASSGTQMSEEQSTLKNTAPKDNSLLQEGGRTIVGLLFVAGTLCYIAYGGRPIYLKERMGVF